MSVATLSETRSFDRLLESTKDAIIRANPIDNVFDHSPLLAVMLGRLQNAQFGSVRMNGRGKQVQTGGYSIEVKHNLGKNTTAKTLTGPWDTVTTDPSDTIRHSRANWKHYSVTATLSDTDLLVNTGPDALFNLMEFELKNALTSLGDLVGDHLYSNGSISTRVTSLQQLASANDTVQGLANSTYEPWRSRGVSARGTAPASISFASGSFAAQGRDDMLAAWDNSSEGAIEPHALFTTYAVGQSYESSLQPQERFTNTTLADGGFQNVAFKTAPLFKDSKCPSGEMYFINFDYYKAIVLGGADFTVGPWERSETQEARASKIMLKLNTVVLDRRFINKLTSITA